MRHKILFPVFAALTLLLTAFLVFKTYFSLDEPNILWAVKLGVGWSDYYTRYIGEGRFLSFFQIGGLWLAGSLAGLKYLRIASLLLTFLFCLLVFRFLEKNKVPHTISFLIATMIFSLPGFSVFICWAECYPHQISSLLSFSSGMILVTVFGKFIGDPPCAQKKENLLLALAGLLQVLSFMNYQNMALVILLPAFFVLFLRKGQTVRNRLLFFSCIVLAYFAFMVLYYLIYKFVLHKLEIDADPRGQITTDYLGKLHWFGWILYQSSKLHFVLLRREFIQYTFSIALALFILRDIWKKRFLDLLFLLAFSVLVFLPHLLLNESWGANRNICLITILFSFYLVLRCFELFPEPNTWTILICCLPFLFLMAINISYGWIKPQRADYEVLHAFVQKLPEIKGQDLVLEIKPPPEKIHETSSRLKTCFDEFNACVLYPMWPIEPALQLMYSEKYPAVGIQETGQHLIVKVIESKDSTFSQPQAGRIFQLDLSVH
jgi:hypothetical protein